MSAVIDLTDMRFGRLTVVGLHPERAHWERILRENNAEAQIAAAITPIKPPDGTTLTTGVKDLFKAKPAAHWRDHTEAVATELTGAANDDAESTP